MAKASDARELVEAQAAERDGAEFFPLNELPNDVLVSVFEAVGDLRWVRHTFPLVCKAWNELYLTKDASPLHETLEVDFEKEVDVVAREWEDEEDEEWVLPVVHASRVLAWAERRAGSVRKLLLRGGWLCEAMEGDLLLEDFKAKDLGKLVAVAGSSLTDISIGRDFRELLKRPFWKSLRTSVVPFGLLRSLEVASIESALLESDLEPLGQLAGSLEELVLEIPLCGDPVEKGLPRFPESLFALKELRRLVLYGHPEITAIPAGISSLKKLEDLNLGCCNLSSLPRELGELTALTKLDLHCNPNLGAALLEAEAFPAELGEMKSLRELDLGFCSLRSVPAFVFELKSLETLTLSSNDLSSLPKELVELSGLTSLGIGWNSKLGSLPEDEAFPAELGKMTCLRELDLRKCGLRTFPSFVGELKSLESLTLFSNVLSSLPKELGELSGLTSLNLGWNSKLGSLPEDEAFPAELKKMKSLRWLHLPRCSLRTVPAFVGELKSLKTLDLRYNDDLQIDAPLDFLIERCPGLREVRLHKRRDAVPWTPEALAHLDAFKAKLRAKNPDAKVSYESGSGSEFEFEREREDEDESDEDE